jgi:hypothetical protein
MSAPEFRQVWDQFVLRLWRDWLTGELLAAIDLNDRQRAALLHLEVARRDRRTAG